MTLLRVLCSRLRAFVGIRRRDADLDEEIETHLALLADEQIQRGATPAEARAAAQAAFGGVLRTKEDYRREHSLPLVETLVQDSRYALRMLGRNPGFAATAILTLGLGIGVNSAIFSLFDSLLLQRLPVARPHELLTLKISDPRQTDYNFSYAAFQQFRESTAHAHVVDIIAANRTRSIRATVEGELGELNRKAVSGNYFGVLGVHAAAGRMLTDADDTFGAAPPVAVLSHRYWARRFGQDHRAIGRPVTIGATVFTIVGIAAAGFMGETVGESPDIFTPLTIQPEAPAFLWKGHSTTWLRLVARSQSGKTREDVKAALEPAFTAITRDIAAATTIASFRNQALQSRLVVEDGSRGLSPVRENLAAPLYLLMVVVGLVLLIACANVANLLLARGAFRSREFSLRAALGAGRLRLVRQLLVEAVLLSFCGGALGLLLGLWGATTLVSIASRMPFPMKLDVHLDIRMLAFTAAVSFAAAIVFGLVPALRAARPNLIPALKGESGAGTGMRGFRLGQTLVVGQIAVSLVLLVGAALFVRSLMNLRSIDLGFNPDRVIVVGIDGSSSRGKGSVEERRIIYERLVETAERVPGVRAASLAFNGLFTASTWGNRITVEGRVAPPDEPERTFANAITPRYFEVMGIQVLRGRPFTRDDRTNTRPVTIVNETFARQFFNDVAPLGKHVGLGAPAKVMMEIVAVVGDAKYSSVRKSTVPMLYVPFSQYDGQLGEMQVKTAADTAGVSRQLSRELAGVDQRVVIIGTLDMQDQIDTSLLAETMIAKLSSLFSLLALLLSATGLYGLIAYMQSQRTAEIGIRMALGADRRTVVWLALRQALMLVAAGITVGAPAALLASRLVRSQLYGLTPHDPTAIMVAVATLSLVAVAAGYIPARRASKLNPVTALRAE